jgi:hypothetical protein
MAEKAVKRQYVLDAGALVAHERRDAKVTALIAVAAQHRIEMVLPSVVLAQVWRDGSRQALLARALRNPGIVAAPLNHDDAKRAGELLRAPVITSDPDDITKLDARLDIVRV